MIIKNIQILIILVFSIGVSAQDVTKVNSDFKLPDSLTYKTEVRIYQSLGTTNYTSLFRMYKDKSKKWKAEFYDHYAKVVGVVELRTEKRTLKSKSDMEFIFQNFNRSHILNLPSSSEIMWKLVNRGDIQKNEKTRKGKKTIEYTFLNRVVAFSDGEGFEVQVRLSNRSNKFRYSNPYSSLKYCPNIDELIYMCEILDLVKKEFGIWKK
jgi:hypothetical protein